MIEWNGEGTKATMSRFRPLELWRPAISALRLTGERFPRLNVLILGKVAGELISAAVKGRSSLLGKTQATAMFS
jgi:hypothetical protein